jgi:DNA end-binding protein Ku
MKLARQLMDTLSDDWNPKDFRDTYTEVLRQVIEAKIEGKEIVAPEVPRPARVTNLTEALRRSLSERPLGKAEGRRAMGDRGRRASRRKAA